MYYPLSQITPNLYTPGSEFVLDLNFTNSPSSFYVGYYWKNSKGEYYTGKNPQDKPTKKLYLLSEFRKSLLTEKDSLTEGFLSINIPSFVIDSQDEIEIKNNTSYSNLKKDTTSKKIVYPYYSPTLPTPQDYQIGEFRRYFCKKTNEILYLEISKEVYDKLVKKDSTVLWQLYFPFDIPWKLTGVEDQVSKTNQNTVELNMSKLNLTLFSEYLENNFLKYFK
jgi:hypothetical protein